jgi:MFS family permease
MSYKKNNAKNALHGFSISIATTVAEPSTILPLIIHHFSSNLIIVGIFTSLLRGGAIVVQLFAAFYAQGYQKVMPALRVVFFFRFLSWFLIGASIYFVGDNNKNLTLWLIGIGLFFFSFSAGFGGIYFKEIIAKVFDKKERGKTMSNKQLFSSIGAILSGGVAGWVLEHFEAPESYAFLFMISALLMSFGLIAFSTIEEPLKENITQREDNFIAFLKNAFLLFQNDARLRLQILITLFGYAFLLAMPFIILKAQQSFELSGWLVGGFITIQMLGSIFGNLFLWKRMTDNYVQMMQLAFVLMIALFTLALFATTPWHYIVIFLLFGIARDGFRNADMNLILEIAPEAKRPVYVAIQSTLTSFGLFFAIPGGVLLALFGYDILYLLTIMILIVGLLFTQKLLKMVRAKAH